jgi:hypothetical protein
LGGIDLAAFMEHERVHPVPISGGGLKGEVHSAIGQATEHLYFRDVHERLVW